jgi:hypothetical protein
MERPKSGTAREREESSIRRKCRFAIGDDARRRFRETLLLAGLYGHEHDRNQLVRRQLLRKG